MLKKATAVQLYPSYDYSLLMSIQNVNSTYSEAGIDNLGNQVTMDGDSSSALNPLPAYPDMTVG
jgi:hypothetical protein